MTLSPGDVLVALVDVSLKYCEWCGTATTWHFSAMALNPKWVCQTCKHEDDFRPAFG